MRVFILTLYRKTPGVSSTSGVCGFPTFEATARKIAELFSDRAHQMYHPIPLMVVQRKDKCRMRSLLPLTGRCR